MPDITKCLNATCPIKDKCYRWMSDEDERQSYADWKWEKLFDDADNAGVRCDGFWRIGKGG